MFQKIYAHLTTLFLVFLIKYKFLQQGSETLFAMNSDSLKKVSRLFTRCTHVNGENALHLNLEVFGCDDTLT